MVEKGDAQEIAAKFDLIVFQNYVIFAFGMQLQHFGVML